MFCFGHLIFCNNYLCTLDSKLHFRYLLEKVKGNKSQFTHLRLSHVKDVRRFVSGTDRIELW